MTATAITALIARFAACLARNDAHGAAACVSVPSAIFHDDRVNALNTRAETETVLNDYLTALFANGFDHIDMSIKAQSMNAQDHCTVWVEAQYGQSNGDALAQTLSRYFCKKDANGHYAISMFEVLEHDHPALPDPAIWAGQSRAASDQLPEIAERRMRPRKDADNARSRSDFATFTAIDDPQLRQHWAKLVKAKLRQGRGTQHVPNDLFADVMRVYVEDDSISLRSSVGLFAYLGGFQARLAMAGARESTTDFDTLSTNQNQDVLLLGKWVWSRDDGRKFHLADVSYIFENTGHSHKMSVVSFTDIDPIMRPNLNGSKQNSPAPDATPRRLEPAGEHL